MMNVRGYGFKKTSFDACQIDFTESVPTPFSLDPDLERDEKILNNLKKMCEEAPSDEMKKIWENKYNKFLETLKRKVTENA